MKKYKIAVLKGDGIGPEIVEQALRVLDKIGEIYGVEFEYREGLIGGEAIDKTGDPLPEETLKICKESDAILLGAVGGPKWDNLPTDKRPEKGLLRIRKELDLYANLRPAKVWDALISSSPLKEEVVKGTDMIVIRELTSGIYYGEPRGIFEENGKRYAINTMKYTEDEIRRIVRKGFEIARKRRKKLTSVDKANVLEVSALWRQIVEEEKENYPDVELEHLYIDNCAMQLVRRPTSFDVIVTGNIFGDILSDEAGVVVGSLGMLPSASIGDRYALYEPVHGSAPDIAGKGIANPIATILSAAMMLKYSFNMDKAHDLIEKAIEETLNQGYRTPDIYSEGCIKVGTKEITDKILENLERLKDAYT
ncbi:3-isopropylmalate dehydrogenase [Aquifex aeolicus]|uniref:3-isopropylmalate dehydrogenase n=1 Tax=Aquifex aeolicus (strain VF5) TaxID=224324 RepID=LEU3_AQUAE|nr:3-isopropylmalate dehydrogenase [Aquifex aeolicus]O66607.1 RecName: Full=3-isopropylmalate dehydrogenase; AltName: Full=3-IPM-DH; AltName: Full=Beta-IPM dehydrogenase; Short=IMDH [Aquifex aeolicus VF5]AAC06564.1 3-isopropylmalate dehydrogenase [Aquifex aeolicus VF5]